MRAQEASAGLVDATSGSYSEAGSGSSQPLSYVVGDPAIWLGLNDYTGKYQAKYYYLMAAGDSAEIWVASSLAFPAGDPRATPVVTVDQLNYLLAEVEENILPTMTEYFAEPDEMDGSDAYIASLLGLPADYYAGDKLVVLVDNIRDSNYYDPSYPSYIAGFYSPSYEVYFDRNIITIDAYDWANRLGPGVARPYLYEGVAAHEFQHLLHDDVDSDEETFVNEGLADFAQVVCGYGLPQSHMDFLKTHPENSLTLWGDQGDLEILADYGIAFLWTYYLYEQYGTAFIKGMFSNPMNGVEGIDSMLSGVSSARGFAQVYRDFSLALLIDSPMMHYKYGFRTIAFTVDMGTPATPNAEAYATDGAPAWGTDYLWVQGNTKKLASISFDGDDYFTQPTPWTSDGEVLWAGAGDLLDNWAIFETVGGGTLSFDTMFSIEEYWDFGFVQVSTDDGATWTSLSNAYTTSDYDPNAHPKVIANLPGLTGSTNDAWMTMSFDLSAYDGQDILIGFRYVTDWATYEAGWFIDNVYVDSTLISDGTDASIFMDLTGVQPVNNDFCVTVVGMKTTSTGTEYMILNLALDHVTEEGTLNLPRGLTGWAQRIAVLVTFQTESDMTSYAEYVCDATVR